MEYSITYLHKNTDLLAQLADGAYCLSSHNGNIFINFFQELPDIPSEMVYHFDSEAPQKSEYNPLENSEIPYWETGEAGIERHFISKIQLTPKTTRQLIENLQATLGDMEK